VKSPGRLAQPTEEATITQEAIATGRRGECERMRSKLLTSARLMFLLTFGTGVLDAATYLGLHGVFTANMTGNVVFVGLGLAGHDEIPLLRASLAIGGFVAGAALIGRLQRNKGDVKDGDPIVTCTFIVAGLVMIGLAGGLAVLPLSLATLDAATGLFGLSMGAQAVAARRVGVKDVSTVVVTSTLAGLAADHRWAGSAAPEGGTSRRFYAVASMGAGASVGALLLYWHLAAAVVLSALILLFVGGVNAVRWCRVVKRGR
jgi:uncharacterized membrane protein YoaK (UPF0700 family)